MRGTRILPVLAGLVLLTGVTLVVPVKSQAFWPFDLLSKDGITQTANQFSPLVQKLVDKFGLNPTEVQQVVDEERQERQEQMDTKLNEKLTQLVSEGKLTEEKKQAIIAKHEQMQAKHDELKDLSPEERREKMQAWSEEMKRWAEDQGIDLPVLMGPVGRGFHRGFKMGYRLGNQ